MAAAHDEACPGNRLHPGAKSVWLVAPWLALATMLAAMVPLFLCMPPWIDTALFDMCAREVLRGEQPYRDFFLHGPPGMILAYSLVRSIVGWGSVGLRAADLLILTLVGILCARRFLPLSAPPWRRVLLLAVIDLFYFSVGEWSHGQSDLWMLLPAIVGLVLHRDTAAADRPLPGKAFVEGLAWGTAFLIKPFVAVPALCAILCDRRLYIRRRGGAVVSEFAGILLGGLAIGAATVAWLLWTKNWPFFYEATFAGWNQDYFLGAEGPRFRTEHLLTWFWPWTLLHLLAVPIAIWTIVRRSVEAPLQAQSAPAFAGFYLGWLFQATYLQHQLCYQMVPAVILSLTILAGADLTLLNEPHRTLRRAIGLAVCGFIAWCLLRHPLLAPSRLEIWPRCWSEGSSAQIRNVLTCETDPSAPNWVRLGEVEEFLRSKHLRDHQLTCYAPSTIHAYRDLDTKPSTRFILLMPAMSMFAGHRADIADEVRRSPERYILSDLVLLGIGQEEADRGTSYNLSDIPDPGPQAPVDFAQRYPYIFPAIFRAGRYYVHDKSKG